MIALVSNVVHPWQKVTMYLFCTQDMWRHDIRPNIILFVQCDLCIVCKFDCVNNIQTRWWFML